MRFIALQTLAFIFFSTTSAFPSFASLRTAEHGCNHHSGNCGGEGYDYQAIAVLPPRPPGPLLFDGLKLVDDPEHPYIAPGKDDLRGPCPALNTLANHGYLPRDGIATPTQMILAMMEGFNFPHVFARRAAYMGQLSNGNPITDLLSIGGKSAKTGPDPPPPAIVGGLNTHGTFEGDASMTQMDAYLGNNHLPNRRLFEQFKELSYRFGGGYYNLTVAAELRRLRIDQSISQNPTFEMLGPRHSGMYLESGAPATVFIDGRITATDPLPHTGQTPGHLDMASAESFFVDNRYPRGFWRPARPTSGGQVADAIFAAAPSLPGRNAAGVNTFEPDLSLGGFNDTCGRYKGFVWTVVVKQYPNPTGVLRRNLNLNLQFLYEAFADGGSDCEQQFPYGR